MYITREKEWEAIEKVCSILDKNPTLTPKDAVVAMVSPDYSATAAMHVAHHLSKDGEMLNIIPVEVPFPDEDSEPYRRTFVKRTTYEFYPYKTVILVEAGVITGGNYRFMVDHIIGLGFNIVTVALFENKNSQFNCDVVGEYYDSNVQELEFYYERYNKHW